MSWEKRTRCLLQKSNTRQRLKFCKSVAMRKKYISICVRCAAPRFCIREIKSGSLREPSHCFHSTLGRVGRLSTIQQSHEAGAGVRHSCPNGRAPTSLRPVRQAMPPEGDLHAPGNAVVHCRLTSQPATCVPLPLNTFQGPLAFLRWLNTPSGRSSLHCLAGR